MIAVLFEDVADLLHVLRLTHERRGDKVKFILHGEQDVFLILCGQGRQAELRVRHVDALFRGDRATVADGAVDVAVVDAVDDELDQAVVDQDPGTLFDVAGEFFIRDRKLLVGTDDILVADDDLSPFDEVGFSAFKFTRSDFRPLGVEQKCDRQVELLTDPLHAVDPGLVLLVGTMREIQSRDVHAREHQLTNDLVGIRRRTESTDDLSFTHTHVYVSLFSASRKALFHGVFVFNSFCPGSPPRNNF